MKDFYITTTLPYVNAKPHIGFALEVIQADTIARFQEKLGNQVLFNTGTDEHGLKIYRKAQEENKDPQDYVNENAAKFDALKLALNLSYNRFIRTTDPHHIQAAQTFWKLCEQNGDIDKKNYKIKYCIGCELEKTDSELEDGKCPTHPNLSLEIIEEENYFFRFSKYQEKLLQLYQSRPDFVIPDYRLKEITKFVERGLEDFSISRLKSKMPWGIPIPNDDKHVMYVWFDALVNYISTTGWPENEKNFNHWWPGIQVAGKDNLRQQSAMWQAMLMSAGLKASKQIWIHGFITANGKKISKSLGNVVDPIEIAQKYGTDALRYFLLADVHPFEDSDFTIEKFEKRYQGDLANGLGNLVRRVATLCEKLKLQIPASTIDIQFNKIPSFDAINHKLSGYQFKDALALIWSQLSKLDKDLETEKPWNNLIIDAKSGKAYDTLSHSAIRLYEIGKLIEPFLPETGQKIQAQFSGEIRVQKQPLFPRLG